MVILTNLVAEWGHRAVHMGSAACIGCSRATHEGAPTWKISVRSRSRARIQSSRSTAASMAAGMK